MPTVQTKKMPDRCPTHPGSGAVTSKTTSSTNDSVILFHKITQHLCAEPGCRQPLGWEYRGPNGKFQWGPGQPSPELELLVEQDKYEQEATSITLIAAITGSALYIAIWTVLKKLTGENWDISHSLSAGLYFPLLTAAVISLKRHLDRRRPTGQKD